MPGKTEIVERIAFETGLPKAHAARAIEVMLDSIVDWLRVGERVTIPGFGSFYLSDRQARDVTNPRTGAPVHVAASRSVRFKAGRELKDAVAPEPPPPLK